MVECRDAGEGVDHRRVGAELLEGGEGADAELPAGAADALEIAAPPQRFDAAVRELLAPLHVQVGAAGDAHLRRRIGRGAGRGRVAAGGLGFPQRAQPRRDGGEVLWDGAGGRQRRGPVAAGRGEPAAELLLQRGGAVLEGAVAGAAAQVAAQGVLHVVEGEPLAGVEQQPVQRHHDAGGAESALRAAVLDDRPLHLIESAPGRIAPLDSHHVPAVSFRHRHQTGGDRQVADSAAGKLPDQDRAGAAVPLLAALLGTGQPPVVAQVVEQQQPGRRGGLHLPVVEDEAGDRRHLAATGGCVRAGSARRR